MSKTVNFYKMAGLLMDYWSRPVCAAHKITHSQVRDLIQDFERGMADIVKKEDRLSIPYFGDFYLHHYKAKATVYINTARASLRFTKVPWHSFINSNYDEILEEEEENDEDS